MAATMNKSKVMSGARAVIAAYDPTVGRPQPVGIFNNVSFGMTFDAQPIYILGRYSPDRIEYTASEPVTITASGWRVYGHGPHAIGMPKLQDLMKTPGLELAIFDRQEGLDKDPIARFTDVKFTSYSTTIASRSLEECTFTLVGVRMSDESVINDEADGATTLDNINSF